MNYDQWLAALCIWREARGASLQAKTGVWHVIQNRTTDAQRRWPRTIPGVILQHAQFSSFLPSDPNVTRFPIPPTPGQDASADWLAFLDCQTVVESPLNADPVGGANMYESLPDGAPKPSWIAAAALQCEISGIRFYKLD